MQQEKKRLFFAFEVMAYWPENMPEGRLLKEEQRHFTVAFLGPTDYSKLHPLLASIPIPPFKSGLVGQFDKILFLPKQEYPRVVAWHIQWLDSDQPLLNYIHQLQAWLRGHGFSLDRHDEFLPHVTIARAPFDFTAWRQFFRQIPLAITHLHLYESVGQLNYIPRWSCPLLLPFEEFEHTADIAFRIRGESTEQLFIHALSALAFKEPELLKYKKNDIKVSTIEEVVTELNEIVARTDAAINCSFKAVSFHGDIEEHSDGSLYWEMIVDV